VLVPVRATRQSRVPCPVSCEGALFKIVCECGSDTAPAPATTYPNAVKAIKERNRPAMAVSLSIPLQLALAPWIASLPSGAAIDRGGEDAARAAERLAGRRHRYNSRGRWLAVPQGNSAAAYGSLIGFKEGQTLTARGRKDPPAQGPCINLPKIASAAGVRLCRHQPRDPSRHG